MNRTADIVRTTAETSIRLHLDLDGTGRFEIATGIGFFDHMLSHIARHGRFDMTLQAKGDLHVDEHHTVEDVGICLGKAVADALGEKRGIERFGAAFVTMDEALARTVIDLSGRSFLVFHALFSRETINGFSLELVQEFFRAVAGEGKMNLHIALLYGGNAHHQSEAIFKSFGRALRAAVARTGGDEIPSTKGTL
ncbi:MAG TPA: imidazoleglycerol-phosphate dehydratase HisB [Bacteroidota bacterium]|nr:imidazoleglycerol-phosphate dehydratase HisB [Bacteroidota bacterium]